MKKHLFLLGFAASIISTKANAQLALETFNSPGIPAGWVMINDGHTVSTSFTSVPGLPATLTANAWAKVHSVTAVGDSQMITTSYFSPAATSDRWLITPAFTVTSPNMVISYQDYDLNSGEGYNVKVSPTAGTTAASFTSTIFSGPASTGSLTTRQFPVGAWLGSSIRVAFHDTTYDGWGFTIDNVKTDTLPPLDLGVTSINMYPFAQTGSSYTVAGNIHNYGINTITSFNLNYSINGGTPVSTTLSPTGFSTGGTYAYSSSTPWVPSAAGSYTIKVWGDNLNGSGVDGNHVNDTLTGTILVVDTLQPKRVMIEEFTQASCDPCANAHINVDTVFANNIGRAEMLRYHVWFPGRDCMDSVTLSSFVSNRASTFYGVSGVPDAKVDGYDIYPGGGYFTSAVVGGLAAAGSPFKISINNPFYNATTKTYSFTASIKAYGPVASGLTAYAALAVDTLYYTSNQSTESIPQTIFPQVAENMFPGPSGTALTAFTTGSTQTVTGNWVKSHPWGSDYSVWRYDSSLHGRIIVWVQSSSTKYVYQSAGATINTIYTTDTASHTGVTAVTGTNGSLDVYPNPASTEATVAVTLNAAADVKVEVYNVLGQAVYSMPAQHRNTGTSRMTIDVSNFAAGEYFVKVAIGNELLNKTLVITK